MVAATFGLARTAVVGAYEELAAAGFLATQPGGSTRVEAGAGEAARAGAFGAAPPSAVPRAAAGHQPAARPGAGAGPAIRFDLRPGQADPLLITERDWAQAMRQAALPAREPDESAARPGGGTAPLSHADLHQQLASHLRRFRGLAVDPADVFVFPSVTLALRAVVATCGLAGARVAFEDPGYAKARRGLADAGAIIRPVPVDEDGIRAGDLRAGDRAAYVTPAHQFPLGGRMPARRRAELLAWAQAHDGLVLEDDYDGEFRYDVPPLTPLRAMPAAAGRVIYFGTSSKILSRGLRVSWAVLPSRFRAPMAAYLDQAGDSVSRVSTAFLASYIASGALTRHHSRAMRTYRARQARFVAACRERIPGARALGIEAGLHVVLAFDGGLDDAAAAARLAGRGLACVPLSAFYAGAARQSGLVCGYSRLPESSAAAAAGLIGQVTGDLLAGG
jgi:GntR family transcriptional regulator/MocR family aminotransferase